MPGVGGASFDVPAIATVLRPDGTIVLHNQASDLRDPKLLEARETYDRALKEAGRKKPPVRPGSEEMMRDMRQ